MKLVVAFPSVWRERFFFYPQIFTKFTNFFLWFYREKKLAVLLRRGSVGGRMRSRRGAVFFILLPGAATRYARLPRAIFFRPVSACFYLKKTGGTPVLL